MSSQKATPGASTPQFRTMLIRKLGNVFPDCEVQFDDSTQSGVAFRLVDADGAIASEWAHIHRTSSHSLHESSLRQSLQKWD